MTTMHNAAELGQAIWLEFIRRSFTETVKLAALVEDGLRGVTSNPTIFDKAISGSDDYDEDLKRLVEEGASVDEIYDAIVIKDIQMAADTLRGVYDATEGLDGYVSLEVSPDLAYETQATIKEAKRLFKAVDRPNVMIKVPATEAGTPAIEALIGAGINVNVTLIFSLAQYEAAAEAYISGLETLLKSGGDLKRVASVASFFVSRVDTQADAALEEAGEKDLQGKIAIANAKIAYARFKAIFSKERWDHLVQYGARVQRPLWASTSTKNPDYPDTLYVDSLMGPHTVNTLPPHTLEAFLDHGKVERAVDDDVEEARAKLERLEALGIDLDAITDKLLENGVQSFADSFASLMKSITARRADFIAGWQNKSAVLGDYHAQVGAALEAVTEARIVSRIWEEDHTVWQPDPDEITDPNRLGWLRIADEMQDERFRLEALLASVREDGFTHALLLGMGGSSLAPEVFQKVFGASENGLELAVLDSTVPDAVLAQARRLDMSKTLFIVSTESGGTVETLSFFKYFYNRVAEAVGKPAAGSHFIAITDAGSKLDKLAQALDFRLIFRNNPDIGGRYSALSFFGLAPAALVGVDVKRLLNHVQPVAHACEHITDADENPGAWLGTIVGEMAKAGRDKLTFIITPPLASFGDWAEQLIAESTGKEGKGIIPVVGEPVGAPEVYGDDRLFVYIPLEHDDTYAAAVDALEAAGQPVVRLQVRDLYSLGQLMFLWEFATAVAGERLGINPFDQPNVEAAKVRAREMVAAFQEQGSLPPEAPALAEGDMAVYGDVEGESVAGALENFLAAAEPDSYVALQAYLQSTLLIDDALKRLQALLRDRLKLATTLGYGPRFLHSTGQLHKGGPNRGLFVQLTAEDSTDADIPNEAGEPNASITFGVLKRAQRMGDAQALREAGRRVVRVHLGADAAAGLEKLIEALA